MSHEFQLTKAQREYLHLFTKMLRAKTPIDKKLHIDGVQAAFEKMCDEAGFEVPDRYERRGFPQWLNLLK
jgi:hypothetical protein